MLSIRLKKLFFIYFQLKSTKNLKLLEMCLYRKKNYIEINDSKYSYSFLKNMIILFKQMKIYNLEIVTLSKGISDNCHISCCTAAKRKFITISIKL